MSAFLAPQTEDEAAAIIAESAAKGRTLAIRGGGTRSGFGNRLETDAILSSTGLSGIIAYNPAEMVLTAKAGTPMAEIERAVTEKGQSLAFEPPDHRGLMGTTGEPTIGGAFSVNASGPRRFVAGAARDHLLGVRFVNGKGEAIKAGGRVMKNVTGLDLAKLLAGSHGTLGFLTEVTFKVLPRPRLTQTVVVSGLDDAAAAHAMAVALAMPVEVTGAAHLPELVRPRLIDGKLPDGPATVLRLEGLPASVRERAEKLLAVMERLGPVTLLDEPQSLVLWQEIRDVHPFTAMLAKPVWKVSVAPTAGHHLVAGLRLHAAIDAFYDWQGGLVWMQMEADPEGELIRQGIMALCGGHASLLRADEAVRRASSSFDPSQPAVAALMQQVRRSLDPKLIFNHNGIF
ncbi:FAD-binding protein [Agrobacterium vitis]|uniref:FAD-binding protein n=1 Tax=Agrobacterium vitis TaxID=373 RepID=UPI000DF2C34D|nr:FAD-binding protein [Agrobacterium vitis]KAA3518685.1 FAD-binding protein [Agrobacterium vitis]MCF1476317.1 FAD-binding protein [Agrobacterium vitis]MUZ96488.1 FAD-binding protein [Agrobacterium vitis]MVA30253.1 FAD-binding protein [Agrobacterium vitis]NOJ36479.1 FAD-binding protein [Agrobacterium vitis]